MESRWLIMYLNNQKWSGINSHMHKTTSILSSLTESVNLPKRSPRTIWWPNKQSQYKNECLVNLVCFLNYLAIPCYKIKSISDGWYKVKPSYVRIHGRIHRRPWVWSTKNRLANAFLIWIYIRMITYSQKLQLDLCTWSISLPSQPMLVVLNPVE